MGETFYRVSLYCDCAVICENTAALIHYMTLCTTLSSTVYIVLSSVKENAEALIVGSKEIRSKCR